MDTLFKRSLRLTATWTEIKLATDGFHSIMQKIHMEGRVKVNLTKFIQDTVK